MALTVLVKVGPIHRPIDGGLPTPGAGRERERPRAKATAWVGEIAEGWESESSLGGYLAEGRVQDRTQRKGPEQRESERGAAGRRCEQGVWKGSRGKAGTLWRLRVSSLGQLVRTAQATESTTLGRTSLAA